MQNDTLVAPNTATVGDIVVVQLDNATLIYDTRSGLWSGSKLWWCPEEADWADRRLSHAEALQLATLRRVPVGR